MGLQFPAFWWGAAGTETRLPTYSIVHLLQGHVMSPRLAAVLWSLLSRRASLIMVGGYERGVGKTTTLSALTAFFPSDTELVFTQGPPEDFAFLQRTQPQRTYIMVNEFSDHTPWYLWGAKAARVFQLTEQGYAFCGTMHAESVEGLLAELEAPPVALPRSTIARSLQLLVMLSAFQTPEGIERRITALHLLQPAERGPGGLGVKSLAVWESSQDRWHLFSSPETWADLARWGNSDATALQREVEEREAFLQGLMTSGLSTYEEVRHALSGYAAQPQRR